MISITIYNLFPISGPSEIQEELYPCAVNGNCSAPLGASVVGLIYVNPEGHLANSDPVESAKDIRDVFGRMGMNDTETVALIGGGHAFGKSHGACPAGAGPSPMEDPLHPWPGNCGTGKGADTYTSGLEGQWTKTPTEWSNKYFHSLLNNNWEKGYGAGGKIQWYPEEYVNDTSASPTMMFTTDIALLYDDEYLKLVQFFDANLSELEHQFKHAWYKLVTRDFGPATRCLNDDAPPPQPFQFPLPPPLPTDELANFDDVKVDIEGVLYTADDDVLPMDEGGYGPLFVRLAWQCANTFRHTDYLGGMYSIVLYVLY